MLKMLKTKNPDTDYPTNMGQKWTDEEENTLLQELDKNINIEIIAQTHNRTIGGIRGRQRTIAYNMYVKKVSIEEIIIKTKLDKEQIMETITRKENPQKKVKITQEPKIEPKKVSLENELIEMRSEIKELKNTIKELVEMMKAVYEFEDVA
jgi:reverse gyrase